MSKANVFADVLSSQPSFHVAQSLDTPSTSSAPSVASNGYPTASTSTLQPSAGQPPTHLNVNSAGARVIPVSSGRKGKQRIVTDQRIINKASERSPFLTFAGSSGGMLILPPFVVMIGLRPCLRQIIYLLYSQMSTPRLLTRKMSYGGCYHITSCNSRQKTYRKSFLIRTARERLGQSITTRWKIRWILKVAISLTRALHQPLTGGTDAKLTIEYFRRVRSLHQRFQRAKMKSSQVQSISSLREVNS